MGLLVGTLAVIWFADVTLKQKTSAMSALPAPVTVATTPADPASALPLPTAVFIGDGYTAGTDGSGWSDIVAQEMGWQEVNLSVPGMGYRRVPETCPEKPCTAFGGLLDKAVAASPTVVVVMGGAADGDMGSAAVDTFYADLRGALPDATIYAVGPAVSDANPPAWVARTATNVERQPPPTAPHSSTSGSPSRARRPSSTAPANPPSPAAGPSPRPSSPASPDKKPPR